MRTRRPTPPHEVLQHEWVTPWMHWQYGPRRSFQTVASALRRIEDAGLCRERRWTFADCMLAAEVTGTSVRYWVELRNAADLYDATRWDEESRG